MKPDLIIVGAGAAGLAAARILSDAGRSAIILEARDRIGGRILTHHDPASGIPVELGAEFVHGRPASTWNLIRQGELLAVDLPFEHHRLRGGRLVRMPNVNDELNKVMRGLSHLGSKDVSFAQYLTAQKNMRSAADARRFAVHFVEGFDAADPQRISAKSLAEEHEGIGDLDDETQFRLIGGYGSLVNYLRGSLDSARIKVRLKATVSEIRWERAKVECRIAGSRSNGVLRAPRAIIALPLGVLQIPPEMAGAVRFAPDIRAKRDAAMKLASGPVVKAVLRFRNAFWEDPDGGGLKNRIDPAWRDIAFLHAPNSAFPTWWTQRPLRAPVLTAWAGGPKAVDLAGKSKQQLQQAALGSLSDLTRLSPARLTELLESFSAYDWASDPYARGAYSYVTVGGMRARSHLAEPMDNTLFFAGEAADTSGQASTVAGAIASGESAAREALAHL